MIYIHKVSILHIKNMARKKGRRSKPFKLKIKNDTLYSILAMLIICIGGLLAISYSQQGPILQAVFQFGSGLLGWTYIIVPFIFIVGGLTLTQAKLALATPHVLLGSIVITMSLAGLTRAGSLGDAIYGSMSLLISGPGAFLFFLTATIIGFFITFETSIEDVLVFLGDLGRKITGVGRQLQIKRKTSQSLGASKLGGVKINTGASDDITSSDTYEAPKVDPALEPTVSSHTPPQPLVGGAADYVWQYPPLSILNDQKVGKADRGNVNNNIEIIQDTLASFGIEASVREVNYGPAVTQYAISIARGTKLSKINALQSDLALALSAPQGQIRIEAPIPGRDLVGIEIPNRSLEFVNLRQMLASKSMQDEKSRTLVALGLDVSGKPATFDIAKMPHILIAGTTGSGKSVLINTIISSFLFRASPEEVKFIMVDPKRVELTPYQDIPHLLTPVITDVEKVVHTLKWAVSEMERRYRTFQEMNVKNISSYNEMSGFPAMHYIVIIIDEMADIMMSKNAHEVEEKIVRLAQMARAVGIHLILATQRPSVNVLTGLIKANIPARIAFQVTSMIDSRVIIDSPGAEKLLGKGDMLFIPPDLAKPKRIQGAFVSDKEITDLLKFIRETGAQPIFNEEVLKAANTPTTQSTTGQLSQDEKFEEAARLCISTGKASASYLQRRLGLGYARAARIIDQLMEAGIIIASQGNKPHEIAVSSFEEWQQTMGQS
jgi:DNA segregation ATPase FtsK/SpoIIIE, S-DNA-T family